MPKVTEINRVYTFKDEQSIIVPKVRNIEISASGNHRLITADHRLHIIPKGWLHIVINSKNGWEM